MKTYDELTNSIIEKTKHEKARRRRIKQRICAGLCAFTLVLGGLLAAHLAKYTPSLPVLEPSRNPVVNKGTDKVGQTMSAKDDYGAVYDHLIIGEDRDDYHDFSAGNFNVPDAVKPSQKPTTPDEETDHSETNIQVDGVMEADVVKTDGKYIYAISHQNIWIFTAKDGQMELAVKIPYLSDDGSLITKNTAGDTKLYPSYTPELYIADGRVILIVQATDTDPNHGIDESEQDMFMDDSIYPSSRDAYTCAMIYDIDTLTSPTLLSSTSVSGTAISTRLIEDRLYLVSSDSYVYGQSPEKSDPGSYIPKCIVNGQKYLVSSDSVFFGKDKVDCEYLNVLEVDVRDAKISSSLSLLGYSGDIMYQSRDNIYVARSEYHLPAENDSTEDNVKNAQYTHTTTITKISVSEGLSLEASTELAGYFESSFSMDEYNGYLRAVMSVNKYFNQTTLNTLFEYIECTKMSNSLYVLDSSMNVVGSLTELAPDERVYSCRFDGDDAYFVTYRETDPLFHVDLSDVTEPKVISELKIPGFSEHLQHFGDTLFGFGRTDDGQLKLSMFSENEDGSMTELATQVVENAFYSEALYNHHALIVDYEKNLICFGADTKDYDNGVSGFVYYVYSFGDGKFSRQAIIPLSYQVNNVRGFYIGDYFYVYRNTQRGSKITSYSMTGFAQIDNEIMEYKGIVVPEDVPEINNDDYPDQTPDTVADTPAK